MPNFQIYKGKINRTATLKENQSDNKNGSKNTRFLSKNQDI